MRNTCSPAYAPERSRPGVARALMPFMTRSGAVLGFLLALVFAMPVPDASAQEANLTVVLTFSDPPPDQAARWNVGGGPWQNSGDTVSGLAPVPQTVYFNSIPGWDSPAPVTTNLAGPATNFFMTAPPYIRWTNEISITVTSAAPSFQASWATWTLSHPTNFTAFSSGSGNRAPTPCPTGLYAITFNPISGYTPATPFGGSIVVGPGVNAHFTGTYSRIFGNIEIVNLTPGGSWVFTNYPADFTDYLPPSLLSGTNSTVITNAPAGTYGITFGDLAGYNKPPNQSRTIQHQGQTITFQGMYGQGVMLQIHVITPQEAPQYGGVGYGTYSVYPTNAGVFDQISGNWYFSSNVDVTITAVPTNVNIGGDVYESFFFEWGGSGIVPQYQDRKYNNPLTVTMSENRYITILFSREFYWYDDAGDLDGDMLPDEWEILWQNGSRLWATNAVGDKGAYGWWGNPDEDIIPTAGTNVPWVYTIQTGSNSYLVGTNLVTVPFRSMRVYGTNTLVDPAYPLPPDRMVLGGYYCGAGADPTCGVKFINLYECRGLDGYYKGRGPFGPVGDDDPYTNPTAKDTDNDTFHDGWEYYFWRWRSASAFARGVLGSANLSWVLFNPRVENPTDADTDMDGLNDFMEYNNGLDPTYADTDGDFCDDMWELTNNVVIFGERVGRPLDLNNGQQNLDNDVYACIPGSNAMMVGQIGTLLPYPVYEANGGSNIWIDVDGSGDFTLYADYVIKAANLSNHQTGVEIPAPILFGDTNGLTYKQGYEMWRDADGSGTYTPGDRVIVIKQFKHTWIYGLLGTNGPGPGVTGFNPTTAWIPPPAASPNTIPYTTFDEYFGADQIGRISWDPGGLVFDRELLVALQPTNPGMEDSDGDTIPDGWELYVGLNPNDARDAAGDSDGDGLNNDMEYYNTTHPIGPTNTWSRKPWPTDPGVIRPWNMQCDPHPFDTDWDTLRDGEEQGEDSNPTAWDTDGDLLPDGWEKYAGTSAATNDAYADYDGDGLLNWQEYWCGVVAEWQNCEPTWDLNYFTRVRMEWDGSGGEDYPWFVPPDYYRCPSFLLKNRIITDIDYLRANYGASNYVSYMEYHSPLAGPNFTVMQDAGLPALDPRDSDGDGLDDYWEVFHALNPCIGAYNLMEPMTRRLGNLEIPNRYSRARMYPLVNFFDADPTQPGFQIGRVGRPFADFPAMLAYIESTGREFAFPDIVGPFNFGLQLMDPDGDGLPNADEYPFTAPGAASSNFQYSLYYHTDPTPYWRTDVLPDYLGMLLKVTWVQWAYYAFPYVCPWLEQGGYVLPFEVNEGFDTDNDGVGDYFEINSSPGIAGFDPLDCRNPMRNRALWLGGKDDFVATPSTWYILSETALTRFCVEAWIRPRNPQAGRTQIIIDRPGLYPNPYGDARIRSNFRLGISTNGLPFIMYNSRGAGTPYVSEARMSSPLAPNEWVHVAGTYNGEWLNMYVNGVECRTIRTTERPATGYDPNPVYAVEHQTFVGACPPQPPSLTPTNHFDGYIDEVRVWDGPRGVEDIRAAKDRRLTPGEVLTNAVLGTATTRLWAYYTFDDVPATNEAVVPYGMDLLDTALQFHPTLSWWAGNPYRSRPYSGSTNMPYNYVVEAENHVTHIPMVPPMDDPVMRSVQWTGSNMPPLPYGTGTVYTPTGAVVTTIVMPEYYRNPANPYHEITIAGTVLNRDLRLYNWARADAVSSWLPSPTDNPDATDTDGDGLPDYWEVMYGLDYMDPSGPNGAWGDPDNDGLNNRAEYYAGTNPRDSDTDGDGIGDYDSTSGPGTRSFGELYTDGDGMPDEWEVANGLDPFHYDANVDTDGDGWSNFAEYNAGTTPNDPNSVPRPSVRGSVSYRGLYSPNSATVRIFAYHTNSMDGQPIVMFQSPAPIVFYTNAAPLDFSSVPLGLREGEVWFFGFLDLNNNQDWNLGEPCGIPTDQPFTLGWNGVQGVNINLTDSLSGYARFGWERGSASTQGVNVAITQINNTPSPQPINRWMRWPRNYYHEGDFQYLGYYGLPAATYQWRVGSQNGFFTISYPSSQTKPYLLYPRGDRIIYARNEFVWTMDSSATMYHLQVITPTNFVYDGYRRAPAPDAYGQYRDWMPCYAGEWGPQYYFWRIAGWNPSCESEWSDWQSFEINLTSEAGSRGIMGDVYYFGKAGATNIVIEAFPTSSFSGDPEARIRMRPPCTTNAWKTAFSVSGLKAQTYYLRAYIDTAPANGTGPNGQFDFWESYGFVKGATNIDYQPVPVDLAGVQSQHGKMIVIRDRDTDNDHMPDAWEMAYFGDMNQTGEMDFDNDGVSNLQEYAIERLDTDPTCWDTDGDRLSDLFELLYDGSWNYNPYDPVANPTGTGLNPVRWDTDGDGYSDGLELRYYKTNPLDPNSYPADPTVFAAGLGAPADYDGDLRTDIGIYAPNGGQWFILTWPGNFYAFSFGWAGAEALLGDYDGDGRTDIAVFDHYAGYWYILTWFGEYYVLQWGWPGVVPVPADYDGDGKTDLSIYYPPTGDWYVWTWSGGVYYLRWGWSEAMPVAGDYDGDNWADFAVYHQASGFWYILTWKGMIFARQWGWYAAYPVPGDFDGDGWNDLAVYHPASGNWYVACWDGQCFALPFGWAGAVPVPGDFDADGRTDFAVYDPASGNWYVLTWRGLYLQLQFGWSAAVPPQKCR